MENSQWENLNHLFCRKVSLTCLMEKKRNFGRYQRGNEKHVNRTNNNMDKTEKGEKTNDFQQDTT